MSGKTHLWPEAPVQKNDTVTASVVIEGSQNERLNWCRRCRSA